MKRMTIQQKVMECLRLSLEVRERTEHHSFFLYHPHVQQVQVSIHIGGWRAGGENHIKFECYIDEDFRKEAHKELNKAIAKLKSLLQ